MEGTEPATTQQDQATTSTEPAAAAQSAAQGSTQQEPAATSAEPAAQQGAPAGSTVNIHKYQRDLAKAEAERDAAKAEADGYKALKAEFDEWKAQQEAAKAEGALKSAGCIDTVAAAARLGEFDGDVAKLKEAAPYLFASSDKSKSTGGSQKGTPDPEDERTANMRKLMGLDTEKE